MGHDKSTRLRIKLGSLELEFEGDDGFLRGEVPKLMKATNDLQVIRIAPSVNALTRDVNESLDAQASLAKLVEEFKAEVDSLSELGEEQQLKMQMIMDRMSKADSTLSNLLKKMSDTAAQIVQNLK